MNDLPALPADPVQALAPYRPDLGHGPWGRVQAAHLLRRAVCGGSSSGVARLAGRPPGADDERWADAPPAPTADGDPLAALFARADAREREQLSRLGERLVHGDRSQLAAWWILKLVTGTRAPGARLTLFWHDHFASAQSKVASLEAMRQQHESFVDRGEGPFEALVAAMLRDVAMLRFLDGDSNRRGAPNENLAREILELFTLGVGHYDEQDVREAARALTGYTVRAERFHFAREHHADGPMSVLGRSIDDGDDLCRAAVAHPACPRFVAAKLWRFYVSPEPPDDVLELLAERWREHDLDVGWLVRSLLASRAFHSRSAYRALVKSPVEYVVGVVRALGSRGDLSVLAESAGVMGQTLFEPPGVQGWEGGPSWVHAAAWIARTNFAARVGRWDRTIVGKAAVKDVLDTGTSDLDRAAHALLPAELAPARRQTLQPGLTSVASALQTILCLPEYHLA